MLYVSLALKGVLALGFFILVRLIACGLWHVLPKSSLREALYRER